TTVVASALVSVALVVLAIVAATAASAGAAGAVATIGVLTLVFILRALLGVTGIFVLLHCRISCRIVRCLENRRSRLIRSGFLRSAGGPAFRVTLRGRFRDSFIL